MPSGETTSVHIWWRYHWFPCEMTSEERAQKFHTDRWRVTTQIWEVLLTGWKFSSFNLKHYPEKLFFCQSKSDVTRDDSQRGFLAQHRFVMRERCCNHSEQCHNNVATLRCESSSCKPPLEFHSRKKVPPTLTNWTRWNKRDKAGLKQDEFAFEVMFS